MLETYPVDIAPEQIVRWLMVEGRLHAFDLLVSATRSFEPGALTGGASRRLGEEEREEVSEVSEVGLLEVMPRQRPHIWTLRVFALAGLLDLSQDSLFGFCSEVSEVPDLVRLGRVFEVLDRFDAEHLMQEVHALWAEARDGAASVVGVRASIT